MKMGVLVIAYCVHPYSYNSFIGACDEYWFSHPVDAAAFARLARENNTAGIFGWQAKQYRLPKSEIFRRAKFKKIYGTLKCACIDVGIPYQ